MSGILPNYWEIILFICPFSQTVGKPNQWLILTKMGYLSQILLLLVWYQPSLQRVGNAAKLRNRLFLTHRRDGPLVPDASVARMTGVIETSIHRTRFRP